MCGRLTLKTPPAEWSQLLLPILGDGASGGSEFEQALDGLAQSRIAAGWQPRYNIAPTQNIPVLMRQETSSELSVNSLRWGLVPGWAADLKIGSRMINARSETIDEKRSFSKPLESRRCLVIADGYYEWQKTNASASKRSKPAKQAFWIAPSEGGLMLLAGLWSTNTKATDKAVQTCTVVTTAANARLDEIHDRMPVMMHGEVARRWLDPSCSAEEAKGLLGAAEDEFFRATKVGDYVNKVANDDPACVRPLVETPTLF